MSDTDIEIALSVVRDEPHNAHITLRTPYIGRVLRKLMEEGSYETCYQAMKSLSFFYFPPSDVLDKPEQIRYILDRMVQDGYSIYSFVTLVSGRFGGLCYLLKKHPEYLKGDNVYVLPRCFDDYWESLFRYEVGRRDTLRAWGVITRAFRGFVYNREKHCMISRERLGKLVDSLYGLMLDKNQLKDIELKPGGLPERVSYLVREKGDSERDRLGRVREPRVYKQRGDAPGLNIANLCRDPAGCQRINITGQKVLAIASYFSKKRRKK